MDGFHLLRTVLLNLASYRKPTISMATSSSSSSSQSAYGIGFDMSSSAVLSNTCNFHAGSSDDPEHNLEILRLSDSSCVKFSMSLDQAYLKLSQEFTGSLDSRFLVHLIQNGRKVYYVLVKKSLNPINLLSVSGMDNAKDMMMLMNKGALRDDIYTQRSKTDSSIFIGFGKKDCLHSLFVHDPLIQLRSSRALFEYEGRVACLGLPSETLANQVLCMIAKLFLSAFDVQQDVPVSNLYLGRISACSYALNSIDSAISIYGRTLMRVILELVKPFSRLCSGHSASSYRIENKSVNAVISTFSQNELSKRIDADYEIVFINMEDGNDILWHDVYSRRSGCVDSQVLAGFGRQDGSRIAFALDYEDMLGHLGLPAEMTVNQAMCMIQKLYFSCVDVQRKLLIPDLFHGRISACTYTSVSADAAITVSKRKRMQYFRAMPELERAYKRLCYGSYESSHCMRNKLAIAATNTFSCNDISKRRNSTDCRTLFDDMEDGNGGGIIRSSDTKNASDAVDISYTNLPAQPVTHVNSWSGNIISNLAVVIWREKITDHCIQIARPLKRPTIGANGLGVPLRKRQRVGNAGKKEEGVLVNLISNASRSQSNEQYENQRSVLLDSTLEAADTDHASFLKFLTVHDRSYVYRYKNKEDGKVYHVKYEKSNDAFRAGIGNFDDSPEGFARKSEKTYSLNAKNAKDEKLRSAKYEYAMTVFPSSQMTEAKDETRRHVNMKTKDQRDKDFPERGKLGYKVKTRLTSYDGAYSPHYSLRRSSRLAKLAWEKDKASVIEDGDLRVIVLDEEPADSKESVNTFKNFESWKPASAEEIQPYTDFPVISYVFEKESKEVVRDLVIEGENVRPCKTNVTHDSTRRCSRRSLRLIKLATKQEKLKMLEDEDLQVVVLDEEPAESESIPDLLEYDAHEDRSFEEKLKIILAKPYDKEEHDKLLEQALRRNPVERSRNLRGNTISYPTDHLGFSYVDHYPDFEELLNSSRSADQLKLLRGFFFWLQHNSHPDSYKPWMPSIGSAHCNTSRNCIILDA